MGAKDICTTNYFEDNSIFADFINGCSFNGRKVILPDNLKEANKELLAANTNGRVKVVRDSIRKMYKNTLINIYVLEHQQSIDYHMVIRNMLSEAMEYDRQWHEIKKSHGEKKDLHSAHEYLSGMEKNERFIPVITWVIYYGQDKWDAATKLHDVLNMEGLEPGLIKYISNYSINVFDYHDYDNFNMFSTELKQVFSFLKYAPDKRELQKYIAENREDYYNISKESCELIATLTNSKELLNVVSCKNMEGGINVCKALEDIKLEGIEKGIEILVRNNIEEGIPEERTIERLVNAFDFDRETAEEYYNKFSSLI